MRGWPPPVPADSKSKPPRYPIQEIYQPKMNLPVRLIKLLSPRHRSYDCRDVNHILGTSGEEKVTWCPFKVLSKEEVIAPFILSPAEPSRAESPNTTGRLKFS